MTNHYRFVDRTVAAYVKSQIESGDRTRVKNELQHLCRLYRRGYRLQVEQAVAFENTVVGLLYTQRSDEKVRRWALNALARLGKEASCMQAILETLGAYNTEPQTAAAAIAAIYRISRRAEQILRRESYDRQMVALAALQHVDAERLDLSALPVDVETASPDLLRLALLVVGLNRAPANLLNPRHTNAEMVRALGAHHDGIVSQYSVWAITENPSLGVSDLGINIKDIEQQPPNVRAWIFQLLGMRPNDAEEHLEYLRLGMEDPSAEARAGLASGLKNTYFDGLDPLMLDWFLTERDSSVRLNVLDHLVTQAHRCPNYEAIVLEVYEKEPRASRERMRANAAGTRIFGKFAAVDLDGSTDLFRQGGLSIMNNFNFTGPINAGAFAAGGSAENSGSTSIHFQPQTIELIQSELAKAERALHAMAIDEPLKSQALEHVVAAKSDPTPEKTSKAVQILNKVESIAGKTSGLVTALAPIAAAIGKAAGLTP